MKQRVTAFFLLCLMLIFLALSDQTAQAVRQGLHLCAASVIPSLFPFFVLTGLLTALGGTDILPRPLVLPARRLLRCSESGVAVFFLGILGGYPLGARMIAQLCRAGRISAREAQHLLLFCNNAGPAFILGMVGLGRFGSLRIGVWLYLIHVFSAALLAVFLRKRGVFCIETAPSSPRSSFAAALVEAVTSAGNSMVHICAFIVFFVTLLQLLAELTGISHPLLLGAVELTNGSSRLGDTRMDFLLSAALLGWGGLSVHMQTAAVLQGINVHFAPYLCAKFAHALLSFCAAAALSGALF